MDGKIKILSLCGSIRKDSYNMMLLREFIRIDRAAEYLFFDISGLPLYSQEIEEQGFPLQVMNLYSLASECSGLIIVSPEYNHSVPGGLKNALDWISREIEGEYVLRGKPVFITGASTGIFGTVRGQRHIREICFALGMPVYPGNSLFLPKAHEKCDKDGHLVSEKTVEKIRSISSEFREWLRKNGE